MKERDKALDLMKSMLVVQMIIAHVTYFFCKEGQMSPFGIYTNLVAFSGFMFTFGYVCYKAYLTKDNINLKRRLTKRFIITIIAYYIFGVAYTVLIEKTFDLDILIKILSLQKIAKYSEFLLSFAFTYPLIYIFSKLSKKLTNIHYLILALLSLAFTFIDYSFIKIPLIGVFIGTSSFAAFPIIQYSSYFLAGEYLAKEDKVIDKTILGISILGFILFIGYIFAFKDLPKRFPPSLFWIIGGYLFVYTYFILSKYLANYFKETNLILPIGTNSLIYLVVSNLIIFTCHNILSKLDITFTGIYQSLILIVIVLLSFTASYLCISILNKLKSHQH